MPTADGQPDILSISRDALGRTVVVDTQGTTVLDPSPGTQAGSTFAVNVNWPNSQAEIRWGSSDDPGNNRSLVSVGLYGKKNDSYTTYGQSTFLMRANGDGWSGWQVSVKRDWVHLAQRDVWVGHDAAGALGMEIGVLQGEIYDTSCNNIWGTQWHNLTDYTVLPYAPYNLSIRAGSVTATSFGVDYARSSYDYVDQDEVQWSTTSNFSNVVWTDRGAAGYSNPAGGAGPSLTPGTTHYIRARSHTGAGWGPYSGTISQTTLPAVPPGLVVASSPSGTSATLTFSPPGGISGVRKYTYERRATGTTAPVVSKESSGTVATEDGLTPGNSYDWRASAWIDTYQSPWTEWVALVQAKPNINPGDYFDGSTPDKTDLDYSWTGTPNGSTSIATAKGVAGWAAYVNSGAAVLYRVTAGIFSTFAARVQFTADTTGDGHSFGQTFAPPYATEVTQDAMYVGSIHVAPSRSQGLMAVIDWRTSAGVHISYTTGTPSLVAGGTWARLTSGGIAPAGAAWAAVRAMDVNIPGWSVWHGGDTLDLDGAMISLNEEFPYFDGSTADTDAYVYDWSDPAKPHESTSTRTPTAQVVAAGTSSLVPSNNALIDPDCNPVPAPPRPPAIPDICIEDTGIWRRYYAKIPASEVADWLAVVPTMEVLIGAIPARQVRIRMYPNPFNYDANLIDTNEWCSEQIVSYAPANTVLTLDGVTQRAWAEVNGGSAQSADHLLYGTNGTPATWPILSCGIPYLISLEVPVDAPPGNVEIRTALTRRM